MLEIGLFLYLGGMVMLGLNLNYILSMLLSLEYMMLSLFILLIMVFNIKFIEFVLFYMVLSVCEASLGLGLLILGMMSGGNNLYRAFDLMKW